MGKVKLKDRVPIKELRERLGIDDIILILQQNRLQWHGHVLRKEDTDWVKKCMNMRWRAPDQRKKGKEEYLYSAFLHQGTHKALRHGVV